jgi:hypothetical protein
MFENVTKERSRWRIFWPEVTDLDGAKEAIKLGYGACFILAGLSALTAAVGPRSGFVDAVVFAVLGLGVRRNSRAAAVIGVALMSLSIFAGMRRVPVVGGLTIILFVCLLSSVRGTFAYRKLIRTERGQAGGSADGATAAV